MPMLAKAREHVLLEPSQLVKELDRLAERLGLVESCPAWVRPDWFGCERYGQRTLTVAFLEPAWAEEPGTFRVSVRPARQ